MRKLIIGILFLLGVTAVSGQLQINLQLPPIGLTVKSQLWNMAVVNTAGMELPVQLILTMTDVTSNEVVFRGQTRTFQLPVGIKQIRMADLLPIFQTDVNPSYPVDNNSEGFLPVGAFRCCFLLRVLEGYKQSDIEECQDIQVEPLSPPVLISPSDNEGIEPAHPQFIWSPPMPYTLFRNLQYDLFVTEVNGSQSAGDAIQRNIPLLHQQNLTSTSFQYPLSIPGLDTGKLYAWQVIAKNNMLPVAKSEAWIFKMQSDVVDTVKQKESGIYYAKLVRDMLGSPIICSGVLHFAYDNEYNQTSAKINIYDITGKNIKQIKLRQDTQSLRYGENLISLDLQRLDGIAYGHFYLLELEASGGGSWYLKFEYKK